MKTYYIDPHYRPAQDKEALTALEALRFTGTQDTLTTILNLATSRHAHGQFDSVAFLLTEATASSTGQPDRLDNIAETAHRLAAADHDTCPSRHMPHAYLARLYLLADRHLYDNPDLAGKAAHHAFDTARKAAHVGQAITFHHTSDLFKIALTHAPAQAHGYMIEEIMDMATQFETLAQRQIETQLPVLETVLHLAPAGSDHQAQALSFLKSALQAETEAERPNPVLTHKICTLGLEYTPNTADKQAFREGAFAVADKARGLLSSSSTGMIKRLYELAADPQRPHTELSGKARAGIVWCDLQLAPRRQPKPTPHR